MLDSLRFVKYVRSFMDGRVRVRHPALRDTAIAGKARAALLRVDGVRDIELNTLRERPFVDKRSSPPGPLFQKTFSGTGTGPRRCLVARDIPA